MKPNFPLKCTLLAGFSSLLLPSTAQTKKPNILFIAIDDLRASLLPAYGDAVAKTPNIDRIVQKGTVFTNSHCQFPVSGGTRACLMTGQRPDINGVKNLSTLMRDVNPNLISLPQHFLAQGYNTTGVGKIYDPRCVSSGDPESWSTAYPYIATHTASEYYNSTKPKLGYRNPTTIANLATYEPSSENYDIPDNGYNDGVYANKAINLLTTLASKSEPFFLCVGFQKPHLPFIAPKKYWDMYDENAIPVAVNQLPAKNGYLPSYHGSDELIAYGDISPLVNHNLTSYGIGLPEAKQKELKHAYYACLSYVDAQIGKLLDKLTQLGIADNTIILLYGDHGFMLGEHDMWAKHNIWQETTSAPLIISAPGIAATTTNAPVEFVDVYPTLVDLAGISLPNSSTHKLNGVSLVPLMKKNVVSVKDFAVCQQLMSGNQGYSFRTERYRMHFWMDNSFNSTLPYQESLCNKKELYDYQTDPYETENVYDKPEYADIRKDLEQKAIRFFNEMSGVSTTSGFSQTQPNLRIGGLRGTVTISGLNGMESIKLYNIQGVCLTSRTADENTVSIGGLDSGIYIVEVDTYRYKVKV